MVFATGASFYIRDRWQSVLLSAVFLAWADADVDRSLDRATVCPG